MLIFAPFSWVGILNLWSFFAIPLLFPQCSQDIFLRFFPLFYIHIQDMILLGVRLKGSSLFLSSFSYNNFFSVHSDISALSFSDCINGKGFPGSSIHSNEKLVVFLKCVWYHFNKGMWYLSGSYNVHHWIHF